jgi:hypothetical protein
MLVTDKPGGIAGLPPPYQAATCCMFPTALRAGGVIQLSEKKRHRHMQRAVWKRMIGALATADVGRLAE